MRKIIKVTLNENDVFDGTIIDHLKDKKNKAGQLKRLAYDRILSLNSGISAITPKPVQSPAEGEDAETINKLDRLSKLGMD